eukprot:4460940-Prymnesium_polylepis.1
MPHATLTPWLRLLLAPTCARREREDSFDHDDGADTPGSLSDLYNFALTPTPRSSAAASALGAAAVPPFALG